jgi:glycosyltransferase involved in cell wall biosynthesis
MSSVPGSGKEDAPASGKGNVGNEVSTFADPSASAQSFSAASFGSPLSLSAFSNGEPVGASAPLELANQDKAPVPRPLRVIHAGPCLERGGAEQWLVDLLRFLDPRKLQFLRTIVTNPHRIDPNLVAELPIPVEVGQVESVRRAAEECDILLFWGLSLNEWLPECRPSLKVLLAHGEGEWTLQNLRSCDRILDHVIAVSEAVKKRTCQGFPTTVIPNGVDAARLARSRSREAVRSSLNFQPGDFVVGYVGRFSPEKRVPLLVEAMARLPARFKLLLVGWGAQTAQLLEQANACIPGRYALVTAWNYLGDYYQAMDAFCLVSEAEGGPLVLIEAMLCGRPVIITPVGLVPEMIQDRINGLIVSADPASISAAALLLCRHPEWARGLAAEGNATAERLGHAYRMARNYEDLLHRLWREKQTL